MLMRGGAGKAPLADALSSSQLAKDLLHPSPEEEKRKHKKKRLVQSPNSYFMDVKCPGRGGGSHKHEAKKLASPEGNTRADGFHEQAHDAAVEHIVGGREGDLLAGRQGCHRQGCVF